VLVDELLSGALAGTTGWQIAHSTSVVQEQPDTDRRARPR
jgi:hypothetical protein